MMDLILNNMVKILPIPMLLLCSILLRIFLQVMGQSWIRTVAHTATLALLPILTYVITNLISGNIALSLGMVGALSIVRFRNPVRSPLELSVYFGAITMGIAAAVSLKWLGLLVLSALFVSITLYMVNVVSKLLTGDSFFMTSFSEGNSLSTFTAVATKSIESIEDHECLISKSTEGHDITYVLASASFDKLKELEREISNNENIKSLLLNKN